MERRNRPKDFIKIGKKKKTNNPCQANHSPSIPSISPMSMLCQRITKGKREISELENFLTKKKHRLNIIVLLARAKQIRKQQQNKEILVGTKYFSTIQSL